MPNNTCSEFGARLLFSRRKTISLEVREDASLVVRAPNNIPQAYILRILNEKKSWIEKKQRLAGSRKKICLTKEQIEDLREKARALIPQRVKYYASAAGLKFGRVRIGSAKRSLGSCGAKGNLNFCWRIAMAPLFVIDYVVCHELAHLTERNHSRSFWERVEELFPDYRESKKWLRENGYLRTEAAPEN